MQRLLTGHAVFFNNKYERSGHLFQNRYKAIICDSDAYLLQLVVYINLNPVRGGVVESLSDLKKYEFASHGYLLGARRLDWLDSKTVLVNFAEKEGHAREAYSQFIERAMDSMDGFGLNGGGLRRSIKGSGDQKERHSSDERKLGAAVFVKEIVRRANDGAPDVRPARAFDQVLEAIKRDFSVSEEELFGRTRIKKAVNARNRFAYLLSRQAGMTGSEIARRLSKGRSAVSKMIQKGELL